MKTKIINTAFLAIFILSSCMSDVTPIPIQTSVPSLTATQNIVLPTQTKTPIPLPTATQTSTPPSPHEIFEEFSGRYPIIDLNGQVVRTLTIMPDGIFHYEEFSGGKTNLVINGSIVFEKTTIQLIPLTAPPQSFATIFILTRWHPRKYLIEESRKNEFCDSIMLGYEPRNDSQGVFYMKEGDWNLQIESQVVSLTGVPFCLMD